MKQKLTLIAFLVFLFTTSFEQTIEIGQKAGEVKQLVEWTTRTQTGYDSFGNSKGNNVVWDMKYFDGEISEVIQCYSKQFLIDFMISADFCTHYIIESGKLSYILTQYEDVPVSKLKELFAKFYRDRKVEDLYFSEDFKNYSKIYLHENGLATVEYVATNLNDLPASIKEEINKKLNKYEEAKQQRLIAEGKEEHEQVAQNRAKNAYGGSGISKGPYNLNGRSGLSLPKPCYPGNEEGIVVVQVTVDKNGTVTKAEPGVKGSNTANSELISAARKAALQAKFNANKDAPAFQVGTITYRFVID